MAEQMVHNLVTDGRQERTTLPELAPAKPGRRPDRGGARNVLRVYMEALLIRDSHKDIRR